MARGSRLGKVSGSSAQSNGIVEAAYSRMRRESNSIRTSTKLTFINEVASGRLKKGSAGFSRKEYRSALKEVKKLDPMGFKAARKESQGLRASQSRIRRFNRDHLGRFA